MALYFSNYVRGGLRIPQPESAGEVVALRFKHTLTTTQNADGNIIDLGILPAYFRPVVARLASADVDSDGSPAVVFDVGLMTGKPGEALDDDGNARTCGDEFFDGAAIGQTGGVAESTERDMVNIAAVDYDRSIGLKVVTDSDTAVEGDVELIVLCAS